MGNAAGRRSRRRGKVGTFGVACLALATLASACGAGGGSGESGGGEDAVREDGGELFAMPADLDGDVQYLLPEAGGCQVFCHSIFTALYDPLVVQDPGSDELHGVLADSWEPSADGLTWTFTLKPEVTFHDGSPVTAEDVRFSFELPLDDSLPPQHTSYTKALRANVDSVEAVDERTVVFRLAEPQANFIESVIAKDQFGIVSRAAYEAAGYEEFGRDPVGSGPFRFDEWSGQSISLVRNEDYTWGPAFTETAGGPPSLERLTFQYIAEPATRLAAFDSGEVQAMRGIPSNDHERLATESGVTVLEVEKNGSPATFEFNTESGPTSDVRVRRAIALAIDRAAFNDAVFAGVNEPICTLLESRMRFVDEDACIEDNDPEAAAELLDDAGWVEGDGDLREKDGEPLELTAIVYDVQAREMEYLQGQLATVGIGLDVRPGSELTVLEQVGEPTGWDIVRTAIAGWTNEDPNILRAQYHSSLIAPNGTSNRSRYDNPEVDRLLDEGLVELDPARRQELYEEVQGIIAEDVPLMPLVSVRQDIAMDSTVHGITPDVRGTNQYFYDVWVER